MILYFVMGILSAICTATRGEGVRKDAGVALVAREECIVEAHVVPAPRTGDTEPDVVDDEDVEGGSRMPHALAAQVWTSVAEKHSSIFILCRTLMTTRGRKTRFSLANASTSTHP